MSSNIEVVTIHTSEQLFKLTSEGVRIGSDEAKRHITISELVSDLLAHWRDNALMPSKSIIETHLSIIDPDGEYEVVLTLERSSKGELDNLDAWLAKLTGRCSDLRNACSVLVMSYIADRESARIASRIGIPDDKARLFSDVLRRTRDNVHPVRQ